MSYEINSKKEYHETMVLIYNLMNKGEQTLTADEIGMLSEMTKAAECYEDEVLKLQFKKEPASLFEWIERELFEQKMTQSNLAEALGMSKSKVSEIISGKRKPDVKFIKGIYHVLKPDPKFLLESV